MLPAGFPGAALGLDGGPGPTPEDRQCWSDTEDVYTVVIACEPHKRFVPCVEPALDDALGLCAAHRSAHLGGPACPPPPA